MSSSLEFNGSMLNVARCAARLSRSVAQACLHRIRKGPRRPDWNWTMELSTQVLKNQLAAGFAMGDIEQSRRYLDSLVINSPVLSQVRITPFRGEKLRRKLVCGEWRRARHNPSVLSRRRIFVLPQGPCQPDRDDHAGSAVENIRPRLPSDAGAPLPRPTGRRAKCLSMAAGPGHGSRAML